MQTSWRLEEVESIASEETIISLEENGVLFGDVFSSDGDSEGREEGSCKIEAAEACASDLASLGIICEIEVQPLRFRPFFAHLQGVSESVDREMMRQFDE